MTYATPLADRGGLPLPRWVHLPGRGTAPDEAPLARARAACPPRVDPAAWQQILPYRYGWALFEAGFHWEAHEVWEAVWLACRPNSRERLLLQGLIQLANARLKQRLGRQQAVERLLPKAAALLAEALAAPEVSVMGLDDGTCRRLLKAL